jgi:hypothetical protein
MSLISNATLIGHGNSGFELGAARLNTSTQRKPGEVRLQITVRLKRLERRLPLEDSLAVVEVIGRAPPLPYHRRCLTGTHHDA